MPNPVNYPNCYGPYLRFAIANGFTFDETTGFEDYEYDADIHKLFFLVELISGKSASAFVQAMRKAGFSIQLPPLRDNVPYITVRTNQAAVLSSASFPVWNAYVSRVELSLPLKPFPARGRLDPRSTTGSPHRSLLIGVLDSGCPFAAAHFLRTSAPASTRVLAIWDQDASRVPIAVPDAALPTRFGEPLQDFDYGLEFRRQTRIVNGVRQLGLDRWIQRHVTPSGAIDEDGCYADGEFAPLKYRQSHGASVMDLFAGRVPPASRAGPPSEPRDPPSWKVGNPATDPTCNADVVFVQFPQACLQDHTGVWLPGYVVDGIRYVLSCANPVTTTNVVINLSYGVTTGPHDGTSALEMALVALLREYDGVTKVPKLDIVLAAGNAYLTDGHVMFIGDGRNIEWAWRLSPDNTVACFAEVWMKKSEAPGVTVTFISPTGVSLPVFGPVVSGPNTVWVVYVGPTTTRVVSPAEHGRYEIHVAGVARNVEVHAYLARTDPNLNVRTGAKASRFVDAGWEQTRSAAACHRRINGEFDRSGSLVDRFGTLNGLATDHLPNSPLPLVAGGYIYRFGQGSTYTSAGPDRSKNRNGPDYALPCDDNHALSGIRARGNRSGSVFRLIGTSTAAPQLARYIARGQPLPVPTDPPTTPKEVAKRGAGNLPPP